ncbi:hypothetical protein DFH94DRAFT_23699 [Russula ochroleuca]|jgi:hypothetical protein|uniref:Uncharacterized protein n=1 Tax=Russula ochroleuca TaxID=152965 RepID=A0A9P5TES2_9AGAM|nr:hypothetical protein DFH94DRAFT_23699 [Russula ochroleuca]
MFTNEFLSHFRGDVYASNARHGEPPIQLVPSSLDAFRRGVQVTLNLDLGFNDQGEMTPFQGGANKDVVHRTYKTLYSDGNARVRLAPRVAKGTGLMAVVWSLNRLFCTPKFTAVDD